MWNVLPNGVHGLTPEEIYSGTKLDNKVLRSERTWGCPAYVLDPKLQDGKKLPKWSPRTRRGQYLGKSPVHASTVGLIRNISTGCISPKFHVIYDSKFQTASDGYEDNEAVASHIWEPLLQHETEQVLTEAEAEQQLLPNLYQAWLTPTEQAERRNQELNAEVPRRIRNKRDDDRRPHNNNNQQPEIIENDVDPVVVDVSDSETEEGYGYGNIENFRRNTPRRSGRLQSSRSSARIAGREPKYMSIFCSS